MTHEEIIAAVESMTVLELADLVKAMEEKFGVSAAAPVAVVAGGAAAGAAAEEEKTEFDVVLADAGSEKIKVIKVVREVVSGLGLKEAKDIVEAAPKTLKEGVSKEEAEQIKAKFAEVGAKVEIRSKSFRLLERKSNSAAWSDPCSGVFLCMSGAQTL